QQFRFPADGLILRAAGRGPQPTEALGWRQTGDAAGPDAGPHRVDKDRGDAGALHRARPAFVIVGDAADFNYRFGVRGKVDQSVMDRWIAVVIGFAGDPAIDRKPAASEAPDKRKP